MPEHDRFRLAELTKDEFAAAMGEGRWILLPFGLAVVWWAVSDATGLTQRRAIDKMEARKQQRRERDMKALGLDVRRDRRIRVLKDSSRKAPPPPPPPTGDVTRRDPKI